MPPYTPQLNPIEEVFSKWKHYIKLSNCENVPSLEASIMNSSLLITTADCNAFFNHMKTFLLKGIRREAFKYKINRFFCYSGQFIFIL